MTTRRYRRTVDPVARELKEIAYSDVDTLTERVASRLLELSRDITSHTLSESVPDRGLVSSLANLMTDQGVRWCVIGGLAINVRGQPRGTADVDALVDSLPNSQTRDPDYSRRFGFYPSRSSTGTVQTIDHRQDGQAELLLADDRLKVKAIETASQENVLGVHVPVASAEALVCLKARAAVNNPARRAKDGADVVSVALANELDLGQWLPLLSVEEREWLGSILPR